MADTLPWHTRDVTTEMRRHSLPTQSLTESFDRLVCMVREDVAKAFPVREYHPPEYFTALRLFNTVYEMSVVMNHVCEAVAASAPAADIRWLLLASASKSLREVTEGLDVLERHAKRAAPSAIAAAAVAAAARAEVERVTRSHATAGPAVEAASRDAEPVPLCTYESLAFAALISVLSVQMDTYAKRCTSAEQQSEPTQPEFGVLEQALCVWRNDPKHSRGWMLPLDV
jgi:hypothetical protein